MNTNSPVIRFGLKKAFDYIGKDPDNNLPRLMEWVDRFAESAPDGLDAQRTAIREVISQKDSSMYRLLRSLWTDLDEDVLKNTFETLILNAALTGWRRQEALRQKYDCPIPWLIVFSPERGRDTLDFDTLDALILQGKEMGVYAYLCVADGALRCRWDLIALCRKHHDCQFFLCTDGQGLDDELVADIRSVKNLIVGIRITDPASLRTDTDKQTPAALALRRLQAARLAFGVWITYTRHTAEMAGSDALLKAVMAMGAKFALYAPPLPGGSDTDTDPTPAQRTALYQRLCAFRKTAPLLTLDIPEEPALNDGCLGGGKRYLFVRADGTVCPCVGVPEGQQKIQDTALLDILRAPTLSTFTAAAPAGAGACWHCPLRETVCGKK